MLNLALTGAGCGQKGECFDHHAARTTEGMPFLRKPGEVSAGQHPYRRGRAVSGRSGGFTRVKEPSDSKTRPERRQEPVQSCTLVDTYGVSDPCRPANWLYFGSAQSPKPRFETSPTFPLWSQETGAETQSTTGKIVNKRGFLFVFGGRGKSRCQKGPCIAPTVCRR